MKQFGETTGRPPAVLEKEPRLPNLQLKGLFPDIPARKTQADLGHFLLHIQYYYGILQTLCQCYVSTGKPSYFRCFF